MTDKIDTTRDAVERLAETVAGHFAKGETKIPAAAATLLALLTERDEARAEIACPCGPQMKPELCSAGTCPACLRAHLAYARAEIERLKTYARTARDNIAVLGDQLVKNGDRADAAQSEAAALRALVVKLRKRLKELGEEVQE